jgi:hypothetical protein
MIEGVGRAKFDGKLTLQADLTARRVGGQ